MLPDYVYVLILIVVVLGVIFIKKFMENQEIEEKKIYDVKIQDGFENPVNPVVKGLVTEEYGVKEEEINGNKRWIYTSIMFQTAKKGPGGSVDDINNMVNDISNNLKGIDYIYVGDVDVGGETMEDFVRKRKGVPYPHTLYMRLELSGNYKKMEKQLVNGLRETFADDPDIISERPTPGYFKVTMQTEELAKFDVEDWEDKGGKVLKRKPVLAIHEKPGLKEKSWGSVQQGRESPQPQDEEMPTTSIDDTGIIEEEEGLEVGEDGMMKNYGGVRDKKVDDLTITPGFTYKDEKPIKASLRPKAIGGYLVGTAGSGKSYALCSVVESMMDKYEDICPVFFDKPGDNLPTFVSKRNNLNEIEKERINSIKDNNEEYDHTPKQYNTYIYLLGNENNMKNNPCDELFKIELSKLKDYEIKSLLNSLDEEFSDAQMRIFDTVLKIANRSKKDEGFNIEDLREIVRNLYNNAEQYKDILLNSKDLMFSKEDIKENDVITKKATAQIIVKTLTQINEKLEGLFVRKGGTPPEKILQEGRINGFMMDSFLENNHDVRNVLVGYILRKLRSYIKREKGNQNKMKYPFIVDEAQEYLEYKNLEGTIKGMISEDRKYGINVYLTFLAPSNVKDWVIEQCDYLNIVLRSKKVGAAMDLFASKTDEDRDDIRKILREYNNKSNAAGLGIFEGSGDTCNVDKWAAGMIRPRKSGFKDKKTEISKLKSDVKWQKFKKKELGMDMEQETLEEVDEEDEEEDDEIDKELENLLDEI